MSIKGIKAFDAAWHAARAEGSTQGNKVAYAEVTKTIAALKSDGGRLSRDEMQHFASTIAGDPILTAPAKKEAYALLKEIGTSKLDTATVEAMKAEFSLRSGGPFKTTDVPGRLVKNTIDLPDAVQKAVADVHDEDSGLDWEEATVHSTTLAGQPVFVVHHAWLGGDGDADKVQIFSRDGKKLAQGGIRDAMAGFGWDS